MSVLTNAISTSVNSSFVSNSCFLFLLTKFQIVVFCLLSFLGIIRFQILPREQRRLWFMLSTITLGLDLLKVAPGGNVQHDRHVSSSKPVLLNVFFLLVITTKYHIVPRRNRYKPIFISLILPNQSNKLCNREVYKEYQT